MTLRPLQTSCFDAACGVSSRAGQFPVRVHCGKPRRPGCRVKDRAVGIEPTMIGFAYRRLATWLRAASWSGRRELNPHSLAGNQALCR